jgi:hypothetical protein
MISEYLKSIPGIEVFGIAALAGTFVAFLAILVWALRMDRSTITRMSKLPLEDASVTETYLTER